MKVKLEEVERYERPMTMRLAFRFGVITVTGGIQAVIRARISLPDGRSGKVVVQSVKRGKGGVTLALMGEDLAPF